MRKTAEKMIETIKASTSPYQTTYYVSQQLKEHNFIELDYKDNWNLECGKSYFINPYGTTLIAFRANQNFKSDCNIRIASAHIDNPCFRIKYNPEFYQGNYMKLNVELYGTAILNTWLDRPLSIAGRVYINREGKIQTKLVDFSQPLLLIPNLPIHLNHKVNEGTALNPQIDMLPMVGVAKGDKKLNHQFLIDLIAKKLDIDPADIINYDLCIYNCQNSCITGFDNDFLMAPRIDNLSSVQACVNGIINSKRENGIDIIALFDNEEIGNRGKNGALSNMLSLILDRIYNNYNIQRDEYIKSLMSGYYISLDVAHAIHPNSPQRYDFTSAISINDGIAIKTSSKHNYCYDNEMNANLLLLAKEHDIPMKISFLRSDYNVGSTIGSALSSKFPMACADIGIPILAMHSAMETMGINDQYYLEKFLSIYFTK